MCQDASLQASSELAHGSAPSDTSMPLESSVVLELDLWNAVFYSYRSGCGALPLF